MKPVAYLAALAALLAAAGCGGASSSGDAPPDRSTGFAPAERTDTVGGAPKQTPDDSAPKPERAAKRRAGDTPIPLGTPVDARDARVRRAIADLLHPGRAGDGDPAPPRRGGKEGGDGGYVGGLLDRLRRQLREKVGQLPDRSEGGSDDDSGLGVLEMLR
jgi:hypothetical protein